MNSSSLRERSKTSKYHGLYWRHIDLLRSRGVKVYHRKLKNYNGFYNQRNKSITIKSNIAGTLLGLIIFLHERSHLDHEIKKLYPSFYRKGKFDPIKDKKLIWAAEWNCFYRAKYVLNKLGINTSHSFVNKKWVKNNMLPMWIKEYC